MPESLVIAHLHREITNPPCVVKSKSNSQIASVGKFIVHKECCARVDGNRQTFSIHPCSFSDSIFVPLPIPKEQGDTKKKVCSACNNPGQEGTLLASSKPCLPKDWRDLSHLQGHPSVDIVKGLNIEGELVSAFRGKELLLGIGKFLLRVCYSLEGHSLWIPTQMYDDIVSHPPVNRGKKSRTFAVPSEYWDGLPGTQGLVSIQAAFRCHDWSLLFIDHNAMITFHVMGLRNPCKREDLVPSSLLWNYIWSHTHGPSLVFEESEALHALNIWREASIIKNDKSPIFLAVKLTQTVFNGYGAQETCDMLVEAFIYPTMPTAFICSDEVLWKRFKDTVISYQRERVCIATTTRASTMLPYISNPRPFRFNVDGHNRFLSHVSAYRRSHVKVNREELDKMRSFGLLNPLAILQDDGHAVGQSSEAVPSVRDTCKHIKLPNYLISINAGNKPINAYSPFTAIPNPSWRPREISPVVIDVKEEYNSTTLGPFSFQVFILAAWTDKKLHGRNQSSETNQRALKGRRAVIIVEKGRRKRPLALEVSQTSQQERQSKKARKENTEPSAPLVDTSHRVLRNRSITQ